MATRTVGATPVFPIALGGASWSFTDLSSAADRRPPDDELAIRTIHAALDAGVTMIDTARVYTTATHPGHSEALIARALATHPSGSRVLVATKGGHYRDGDDFPIDASAATVRRHCETSLRLLGVDRIDLYLLHWPDPTMPIRSTMPVFAQLRDEGLIRDVGVSNVSIEQLEEAMSIVPIVAVENHFSPFDQGDRPMIDYCAARAISYLAYSPLRAEASASPAPAVALAEAFPAAAAVARGRGVSVGRVALAWLLRLSPAIVPISGASRPETARDAAAAATDAWSDDELAELDFGC